MTDDGDLGGEPACWAHLLDEGVDQTVDGTGGDEPGVAGLEGVDLAGLSELGSSGAIWSLRHGGDLDVNAVWLRPLDTIGEHVNDDVDVLVVVWSGQGELRSDGRPVPLRCGVVVQIQRGASRSIVAGADGLTYLSVHRRRDGLSISRR